MKPNTEKFLTVIGISLGGALAGVSLIGDDVGAVLGGLIGLIAGRVAVHYPGSE